MRVAYLVNQYPKTSHSFIRREIAGVEARGFDVERFTVRIVTEPLVDERDVAERERTTALLAGGVPALALALVGAMLTRPVRLVRALNDCIRLSRSSDRGFLLHLAYVAEACILARALEARGVEHLHAHFGTNATSVALLCRSLGGPPFSFTVHSPLSSEVPQLCAMREKIERARFVVAVSQHGKSQLMRWAPGVSWYKIHVVRCGTDAVFQALRGEASDDDRPPRLVCVARMSAEKGHHVLLRAAAELARDDVDFELLLVGDGPLRAELEGRARELGIADHVRFAGWLDGDGVRDAILSARALVLPSFIEGLPVVLMEALALRRPVVTTWVGAIPELVEHGENGWLVSPGSADSLADACRAVLSASPEALDEMGARGVETVRDRHDSLTEAARLTELFETAQEVA